MFVVVGGWEQTTAVTPRSVFPDRSRLSATDQSHVLWLDLLVNSRPSKWNSALSKIPLPLGLNEYRVMLF